MKTPHNFILLAALWVSLVSGCDLSNPDSSRAVAKVNGEIITENDYEDYLRARRLQHSTLEDKQKEKQIVLDEMVKRLLLAQQAKENKLDQELDVYFQLKRQRENTLARALLRQFLRDAPISDEEVRLRYQDELDKTHKTEYRARHILVKSEEDAQEIIQQLRAGANFANLAKKKSQDIRSASQGGDLGWFDQQSFVPEFFDAVKAMQPGRISNAPVKTEFGWHVIQLENSRPWNTPSFEELKAKIRQQIQQEKIDAMVEKLKATANITFVE